MSQQTLIQTVKRVGRHYRPLHRAWGKLRWYVSSAGLQQLRQTVQHAGWTVGCPCCGWRGHAFYPGSDNRPNALCPRCFSMERHRLLACYLRQHRSLFGTACKVLEIGPTLYLKYFFRLFPQVQYISMDLESPHAMSLSDVMALPISADAFDMVICYHVLMVVSDDRAALNELHRVMKPSGFFFVHEPTELPSAIEVPPTTPTEERGRPFGDIRVRRTYGADFVQRIEAAGFCVKCEPFAAQLGPALVKKYGLEADDVVYVGEKVVSP